MSAVLSDKYRIERQALLKDPVIKVMAGELAQLAQYDPAAFAAIDMEGWDFVNGSSQEYERRGGSSARSIGGPAGALREILL